MKKRVYSILPLLLSLLVLFSGCSLQQETFHDTNTDSMVSLEEIPAFQEVPYTEINGNQPFFSDEEKTSESFESYSDLDHLGRCGTAYACIGQDLMPTEDRESISHIKPTGWQTAEYDFVDGKYLYNRCHLIGFQLAGENANEKNLITGTRYMNVEGMLPFENMTADYIKETGNHVLYRVTPIFKEDELVARGVQMEAWSIEDDGNGICFNVYVYNSQPDVAIDYQTGESRAVEKLIGSSEESQSSDTQSEEYILNTNTRKFHLSNCPSVASMKDKNKEEYYGPRENLIEEGYAPCQNCMP
mgnify:FL=1